jgi:hypothetical protein
VVVSLTPTGQRLAEMVNADLHEWEQSLPLAPDARVDAGASLAVLVDAVEAKAEARQALPA